MMESAINQQLLQIQYIEQIQKMYSAEQKLQQNQKPNQKHRILSSNNNKRKHKKSITA